MSFPFIFACQAEEGEASLAQGFLLCCILPWEQAIRVFQPGLLD
jgi:hypothetical protein